MKEGKKKRSSSKLTLVENLVLASAKYFQFRPYAKGWTMPLKYKYRTLFLGFHPEIRGGDRGSAHTASFLQRLRTHCPAFNIALGRNARSAQAPASALSLLAPQWEHVLPLLPTW